MRCKNCHYSLAGRGGLTELRCPECGTPYDPTDPSTFITAADFLSKRMHRWLSVLGVGIGVALIALFAYANHNTMLLLFAIPPAVVVAIGLWNAKPS